MKSCLRSGGWEAGGLPELPERAPSREREGRERGRGRNPRRPSLAAPILLLPQQLLRSLFPFPPMRTPKRLIDLYLNPKPSTLTLQ